MIGKEITKEEIKKLSQDEAELLINRYNFRKSQKKKRHKIRQIKLEDEIE